MLIGLVMHGFSSIAVVVFLLLSGCAQGSGRRAIGDGSLDTGAPPDSSPTPDSTTLPDAAPDTGTADTGVADSTVTDTGRPDSGASDTSTIDTGTADTGMPGCTSAADCDDGLACNGIERCNAGICGGGTPLTCDDGVACTVDSCTEPGSCVYTPNDSACASGEMCDPAAGCVGGCAESPCRLVAPQCGCPTGQGCYMSGTMRACGVLGSATEGALCSSATSCSAGNICLNVAQSGTAVNVCTRHCNFDSDCAAGALCVYELDDGTGMAVPGVNMCSHVCDPVTQTGCPSGSFCEIFRESMGAMRTFTDCTAPAGTGGHGAACIDASDCRAGYACVDPGTGDQCLHWCDVPTGSGCSGLTTCTGFTTPIIVGGREIGVCF
jgi:hypothetical protein